MPRIYPIIKKGSSSVVVETAWGVDAGANVGLKSADLAGQTGAGAALSGQLETSRDVGAQAALSAIKSLSLAGNTNVGASMAFDFDLAADLAANAALSFTTALEYSQGANAAVSFDASLAANTAANAAVAMQVEIPQIPVAEDAYADEGAPSSNFGSNENVPVRSADALGNDQEIGYILFDLTGLSGLTAVSGCSFDFSASVANAGSGTLTWEFHTFASKPFEEDTLTWNNQPSTNLEFSEGVAVSGGSVNDYSVSISASNLNLLLGNWVMLRGTTGTRNRMSVSSKEEPNTAEHAHLVDLVLEPA